jgi:hypothetical protein
MVAGLMSLSRLAKSDSKLMSSAITQYEHNHTNLPPTLSATQVKNVRKVMRVQLMDLIRTSPNAAPSYSNISQLLFDLGVSKAEFDKALAQLAGGQASAKVDKRKGNHFFVAKDTTASFLNGFIFNSLVLSYNFRKTYLFQIA